MTAMGTQTAVGVIFDMDGVLVDSAPAHFQSWQRLAAEEGGSVTSEQCAATFGRQNRDIIPALFGAMSRARVSTLADRKEAIYRDLIRHAPPIVDGAAELVRDLHHAGVRLAVGSSGPLPNIELVLDALGVTECVSTIVTGDDVTHGKPDPEVFCLAAQGLGLAPERCVVIEDAPAGTQAAHAAGTRVVAVLIHHPAEAFEHADRTVTRLAELSADDLIALARG